MSTYLISEVPRPASAADTPDWRFRGASQTSAAVMQEITGNTDLADSPELVVVDLANQTNYEKHLFVAVDTDDPETVLGLAWANASRRDNPHLGHVDVAVRPTARNRGLGSLLWETALEQIRAMGRTTVLVGTGQSDEPDADDPHAMAAPTGSGRIHGASASSRFALARGFSLEQVERHSELPLPVDGEVLATFRARAAESAGGDYELVSWVGRVPEEWMTQYCVLQTRMSTDAPSAGLEFEEEVWDAERVEAMHKMLTDAGLTPYVTAAVHRPTGTLAGFTELATVRDKPDVVYQENTLVLSDHRGHRLGMLVKAANLQHLAEHNATVKRVHTWNAEENSYMLDINVALGFRQASVWGEWQLKLS